MWASISFNHLYYTFSCWRRANGFLHSLITPTFVLTTNTIQLSVFSFMLAINISYYTQQCFHESKYSRLHDGDRKKQGERSKKYNQTDILWREKDGDKIQFCIMLLKRRAVGGLWHGLEWDFVLPLVDCKWQSKFTLAVGAKMESDSFVSEFERLSGRAGIGMISSLSSPNRQCTFV